MCQLKKVIQKSSNQDAFCRLEYCPLNRHVLFMKKNAKIGLFGSCFRNRLTLAETKLVEKDLEIKSLSEQNSALVETVEKINRSSVASSKPDNGSKFLCFSLSTQFNAGMHGLESNYNFLSSILLAQRTLTRRAFFFLEILKIWFPGSGIFIIFTPLHRHLGSSLLLPLHVPYVNSAIPECGFFGIVIDFLLARF